MTQTAHALSAGNPVSTTPNPPPTIPLGVFHSGLPGASPRAPVGPGSLEPPGMPMVCVLNLSLAERVIAYNSCCQCHVPLFTVEYSV